MKNDTCNVSVNNCSTNTSTYHWLNNKVQQE